MSSTSGLREWLSHASTVVALALALVGVLFVLLIAQLPERLYWTGDEVSGTNRDGIVYYQAEGREWTVNAPARVSTHDARVTVYVDPDDPSHALVEGPVRWIDAVAILGWFVAAGMLVAIAALRRAHRRRRAGEGLDDPDWVRRYLDRSRHPPGRRSGT